MRVEVAKGYGRVSVRDVALDREHVVVGDERESRLLVPLDHRGGHRGRAAEVPIFFGPDCQHQRTRVGNVVAKRDQHNMSGLLAEMSEDGEGEDEVEPAGERQ